MTIRQTFTVGLDAPGTELETVPGLVAALTGAGYQGVAAEPRPREVSALASLVIRAQEEAPRYGAQWYALGRARDALLEAERHALHGE